MSSRRTVFRRADGRWVNKLRGDARATTTSETQAGAVADARRMLRNGGGGELTVFDGEGRVVGEETIAAERWVDMTGPSGMAELLLRVDGYIALVEDGDDPGVLGSTSGRQWLEQIDLDSMSTASVRAAQAEVEAARAALLAGDPALAIEALERVRRSIAASRAGP